MKIIFAGTGEVALPSLEAFYAHPKIQIAAVLTREDAPVGRKRVMTSSPVALRAQELGIPVVRANRIHEETLAEIQQFGAQLGVIVSYGVILRQEVLDALPFGWINLHFSLLPALRGAAPVQRALMRGEHKLSVTVFQLLEELDAGPIFTQESYELQKHVTASDALAHLSELGAAPLLCTVEACAAIAESGEGREAFTALSSPQRGEVSFAPKLSRAEGRLEGQWTCEHFMNVFSAVTAEPGAYVETEYGAVKVLEVRPLSAQAAALLKESAPPCGTVALTGKRAILSLADGLVELVRVQPQGKQAMEAAAWLRGRGASLRLLSREREQ